MGDVLVILKAAWPHITDWEHDGRSSWWCYLSDIEVTTCRPSGERKHPRQAELRVGDGPVVIGFGPNDAAAVMDAICRRLMIRAVEQRSKEAQG
jgi:hypothetical protein